jgi:Phytanoyl-CoA dioxygenase (PhyH)
LADPTPSMGGTFPIRFPVDADPGDDGWHIEGSYLGRDGGWWSNYYSRDRALLMLVLFSDVEDDDAPTRVRVGSHIYIQDALLPFGEDGVNPQHLTLPPQVQDLPIALATGGAGDVYLCHPFLVHAAQRNQGREPRFIAQPGVPWKEGGRIDTPGAPPPTYDI